VRAVEKAGADVIHVDVMDGHFVPNITIGPVVVQGLRKITALPLDTHLMIEAPEQYVEAFARAGSDTIIVHQEVSPHLDRTIPIPLELAGLADDDIEAVVAEVQRLGRALNAVTDDGDDFVLEHLAGSRHGEFLPCDDLFLHSAEVDHCHTSGLL
jgi:hypothetical protein